MLNTPLFLFHAGGASLPLATHTLTPKDTPFNLVGQLGKSDETRTAALESCSIQNFTLTSSLFSLESRTSQLASKLDPLCETECSSVYVCTHLSLSLSLSQYLSPPSPSRVETGQRSQQVSLLSHHSLFLFLHLLHSCEWRSHLCCCASWCFSLSHTHTHTHSLSRRYSHSMLSD